MKANYHTHSNWCDGKDTPRTMIQSAISKGFDTIGFSSHAMLPQDDVDWVLTPEKALRYAAEIRALANEFKSSIRVLCGVEADYIPGGATPSHATYAAIKPDYIIGSVHFVKSPDGFVFSIDHTPDILFEGIADHFGGDLPAFVKVYYAAIREMVSRYDFEIIGHLDLIRKFNMKRPFLLEKAEWYRREIEMTADIVAASGKLVEVNTGAISRGWQNDAYPSPAFRKLLRDRGVRFILSSDAHAADAIDCAFDKFEKAEVYERI